MNIGGIIDVSTKDIPNKAAMVIFTKGCNFKCDFCHNKKLLQHNTGKQIMVGDLIKKIKNNMLVSSVSITGGEPTIQNDLIDLCREISRIGKFISVDTNGSNPEVVKKLLPYINRVALDIKSPLIQNQIERVIRKIIDPSLIINTFYLLNKNKRIEFEVRTTYVENLLNPEDIHNIISFLKENKFKGNYVLQQYQYSEGVGEEFKEKFHAPPHLTLLTILKPYKNLNLPFEIYIRDKIVGYCKISNLFN
jgi:pyruvate formate lyase activating enzyme